MCGILGAFGSTLSRDDLLRALHQCIDELQHRGPDDRGDYVSSDAQIGLAFARLAIMDPTHAGIQPMSNLEHAALQDISDPVGEASSLGRPLVLSLCNGELYNQQELHDGELESRKLPSHSDCQEWAMVVVDVKSGRFVAGRDPIGVRPLFIGHGDDGSTWFCSEAKGLLKQCSHIEQFRPGHFYIGSLQTGKTVLSPSDVGGYFPYYEPIFYNEDWMPIGPVNLQRLHDSFEQAVVRRLMSDVPVGVFISGGLDSSLVASIAQRHLAKGYDFHSFSCGLEGSPDLAAARRVAQYLGTDHHELVFTLEDGIQALEKVIWHLETFDVTTIRASTPMFLVSGLARQYVKVVLSGEGADEVFGGYLYFHNAPSESEFHIETVERVKKLSTADVLRGDRATAAQSLELRVPFLDQDFLDVAMSIHPRDKMCHKDGKPRMEKWVMRYAFDPAFCGTEYLPADVLWRQKEQFSDGVGYNWIDGLKAHCEASVTDAEMDNAAQAFPHDPPRTKEAYYYRKVFERLFGDYEACQGLRSSVRRWIPKWSDSEDPSGRAQKVHVASVSK